MKVWKAKSVFEGIAIGKIRIFEDEDFSVKARFVENPSEEIARFHEAAGKAEKELDGLYERALRDVGAEGARVFSAHKMMLRDDSFTEPVEQCITSEKVNAEFAVDQTGKRFAEKFAGLEDEYFSQRAADILDITSRLIRILNGHEHKELLNDGPVIILARDLSPSETIQMDKDKILSFVTRHGSLYSHTAIIARTMNVPALVGCDVPLDYSLNGQTAIVDGFEGTFIVDPDEETLSRKQKEREEALEIAAKLKELKGKETVTLDGTKIRLLANIGNLEDLPMAEKYDAEGIGLLRSEFIYMDAKDYPSEEEQFAIYRKVAEAMDGKEVIIRTLDVGADKQADYLHLPLEENPAMGLRGIRVSLTYTELLKPQLRAILRASVYGKIAIMFPMIISVSEVRRVKKILEEVKESLRHDGILFDEGIKTGIMIETPAAVMIADDLAKEVDFFSVGTNDLTQYTLAIDRGNDSLEPFYDAHHPAVIRMIKEVAKAARDNGIPVGICGELGADESMTETFLRMGIDELSVSSGKILSLRKRIRETNLRKERC